MGNDGSSAEAQFTYENLAECAQRFLAECPVVVVGTGATIPHGLPSMSALADALLTNPSHELSGWEAFAQRLEETKDLEQALHDVPLSPETVETLVRLTWEIVSSEDLMFHEQLLTENVDFPLADMIGYLLRTAVAHLHVVTTNYDRLVEYAANMVAAYASTGVTAGWLQRFTPGSVNAEHPPSPGFEGAVTILKVHGSLDWFRDTSEDIIGIPLARAIPSDMQPLVVTPGVSKYREVHKDPFRTVMSAADEVLRKATCFACVGYGFNDEHVQPVLVNRVMKEDVPLLLVTRTLTPNARNAFLTEPPKRFLFLENAPGGTKVYLPEYPAGVVLVGVSAWRLNEFMRMISAEKEV